MSDERNGERKAHVMTEFEACGFIVGGLLIVGVGLGLGLVAAASFVDALAGDGSRTGPGEYLVCSLGVGLLGVWNYTRAPQAFRTSWQRAYSRRRPAGEVAPRDDPGMEGASSEAS